MGGTSLVGPARFVYQEPERQSPTPLREKSLLSLASAPPLSYESALLPHQREFNARFSSLLNVLAVIDNPRAIPNSAKLTVDDEAINSTPDADVLLPSWSQSARRGPIWPRQPSLAEASSEHSRGGRSGVPLLDVKLALVDTGANVCVVRLDFLLKV